MRTTSLSDYLDNLQAAGRFVFTTDDAIQALGTSVTAARAVLRRLKHKAFVADPYRGFHVVVPPPIDGWAACLRTSSSPT